MDAGKQQQHQMQQQLMLMQQMQRQKEAAMTRFPSNIDVHLNPHQNRPSLLNHQQLHRPQTTNLNPIHHQNNNNNPNSINHNILNSNPAAQLQQPQPQPPPHQKAAMQLAYQDAWRVCHPDFKRPFSSIEDACERLLPYHVVADYEAEEDDKILDSDTTGQLPSRSQQWDHNIAAKVAEFTATFEKQVLAFNIISRKRGLGEFRTEEKLMMEQLLLQDEKRAMMDLKAELDSRQKATQENHMRMAAMAHAEQARAESQAHAEMMARAPIRASALGSRGSSVSIGHDGDEEVPHDEIMNGWGVNAQRDDKEPSEDFLNDDETENGDAGLQSEWHGVGEFDLNAR